MHRQITREYNYSDVYLVPNKCIVNSRSECDTSVVLGGHTFSVPVIPANMPAVVNENTCKFFADNNWFYIMHRFGIDQVKFIDFMRKNGHFTSISLGVNEDTYTQLQSIKEAGLEKELHYATIDIAHCHSPKAERMIKFMKDNFPDTFLIAGNYNTPEAVVDIESWGADCTKNGIAGGKSCITRYKTKTYRPMVSCILECAEVAQKPIIADGGIEHHGDMALAIACGATMVMAGSLFSGYDQSNSEKIEIDGKIRCVYYGSASEHNKQSYTRVEGKKILLDYKGDMLNLLKEIKEDLQSSISYAGGKDLSALSTMKLICIS
jgi:GMP reductase